MADFNGHYSSLFEASDQVEAEGQEAESDREGDVGKDSEGAISYRWFCCIDAVSDTLRLSWHEVYGIPIIEFLNVLGYLKEKAAHEKAALEAWKRKN